MWWTFSACTDGSPRPIPARGVFRLPKNLTGPLTQLHEDRPAGRRLSWRSSQASRYLVIDFGSGRNTACATLGLGLAVSAFPLYPPVSPISFPLSIANNLFIAQISICTFCVAQLTQAVIETSTQGMDAAQHRTCEVAHGVGGKLAPGAGCKNHSRRCLLWLQNSRIEGLCKVLSHSVAC